MEVDLSTILDPVVPTSLCCVFGPCHSLTGCALCSFYLIVNAERDGYTKCCDNTGKVMRSSHKSGREGILREGSGRIVCAGDDS